MNITDMKKHKLFLKIKDKMNEFHFYFKDNEQNLVQRYNE